MAGHKFANPKEIEVCTEQFEVSVGLDLTSLRDNRPDLNGYRIRHPNGTIYLILDGTRRHIPNPETYNNLFRDWSGIIIDIDIDDVNQGPALTVGAILARPINGNAVYLVSNGVKRHVISPAAMDRHYFSEQRVFNVPSALLEFIPEGQPIS